ncbi:hypothetical protein CF95_gp090 [Erwinia phage PhiEaH1]|jgi:hypothetical protein|uniref:Uncharacterized protein n=1 Tax=Erwinia phage PhiEaH1 TaxID=1401669 RepID=W8CZE3_9CAUD|nr:hypothetical protein CF95_gp090 [Erwinia phage PhiEaH1]AGX01812.1 hypothetical protein [Erwinia phage PhiEaH1]WBF04755.1 hypothetical protein [Erwinia phage vB_Ea277G]
MENKEEHLPLTTLTTEKGPDPVSDKVKQVANQLVQRYVRQQKLEEQAKKDPMFNLRVALLRGNPNRSNGTSWNLPGKKRRW